ncbi:MAG: DMT family transporter [Promethearchaeota archaeon]
MLVIYLELVIMIIIWSFSFILVDIALEYIPPLSLALYRFIIASAAFLIYDIYFKFRKKKKLNEYNISEKIRFSRNEWVLLVCASITGVSFFFLAQYTAIKIIGPSLPALLVCLLAPVVITVLALYFFNEKLNIQKIIGFIISSIGGFLLVTGGNLETLTLLSPNFLGYLFALLTPFLWAIYSTITKKLTNNHSSTVLNKNIAYLGLIELSIFVLINGEFIIFLIYFFNFVLFLCALYLGLGCYVLGYYAWQHSQKNLKSSKVASFLYIEPFLTLLISTLLQRTETIVLWNIIGGLIVLVAVLIINYK